RHGSDTGVDLAGLEPDRALLELRRYVALGIDLDEQHALADARGEHGGRRGHRALADAALSREEQAAPIEKVGSGPAHDALPAAEADLAIRRVTGDFDVRELVGRDADLATLGIGEPHQRALSVDRSFDGCTDRGRIVVHLE